MPKLSLLSTLLLLSLFAWAEHVHAEPPVLRVSLENEPVSLDWHDPRNGSDRLILSLLMRGLLKYDASGSPVCDLCASYSVSTDGKTYRFELASDQVWSDNEKLEASQFVDSLQRLTNPANGFKSASNYREITEMKAESKSTLVILLSEPRTFFPHLLTQPALFPIRKSSVKGGPAFGPVIGPYLLAAWEPGKRLVLEGNPKYPGNRPVFRVDFNLGGHSLQLKQFSQGRLDILANPTTEDLLKLSKHRVQVSPFWATRSLTFNFERSAVADARLRHAILYSLDRSSLPSALRNGERPVTGLIPPGLKGHRQLSLVTADPARAAWTKPVELSLLTLDTAVDRRVAQWLEAQLSRGAIRLKARALPEAAYLKALDTGEFDLALGIWTFSMASPLELLKSFQTGSQSNRGRWSNVAFDTLVSQLSREDKAAAADRLLEQATQILEVQEVAVIPLGYPSQPFLLGPRVSSFVMTPFGDPDLVRIKLK
jgi:oligopeptide transport system substrate-binding protein